MELFLLISILLNSETDAFTSFSMLSNGDNGVVRGGNDDDESDGGNENDNDDDNDDGDGTNTKNDFGDDDSKGACTVEVGVAITSIFVIEADFTTLDVYKIEGLQSLLSRLEAMHRPLL